MSLSLTACGLFGGKEQKQAESVSEDYEYVSTDAMEPELIIDEEEDMGSVDTGSDPMMPLESPGSEEVNSMAAGDSVQYDESMSESPSADAYNYDESFSDSSASYSSGDTAVYVAQKGDTLMKIAFELYGNFRKWKDIYAMNQSVLTSPKALQPGMEIRYEKPYQPFERDTSGEKYQIKNGDTLAGIARNLYGRSEKWKKLARKNSALVQDPDEIYAGFYLFYERTAEELAEAQRVQEAQEVQQSSAVEYESVPSGAADMGSMGSDSAEEMAAEDSQGMEPANSYGDSLDVPEVEPSQGNQDNIQEDFESEFGNYGDELMGEGDRDPASDY
jgi:LysM repeat protein